MPVKSYGVLVGTVRRFVAEHEKGSPHFQIELDGGGTRFRIAVNTRSTDKTNPELLFLIDEHFSHTVTAKLKGLAGGFHAKADGGPTLDYVRGGLFDPHDMNVIPTDLPGPDNDLNEKLTALVERGQDNPDVTVFAFGARFGPESIPDKVFKFKPGNGIHDIHMNQGNPKSGGHAGDNGVDQDGALLFHFAGEDRWVAIFLAFQSQSFKTDARGNVAGDADRKPVGGGTGGRRVRIMAAMVNPAGDDPGLETVTLLNPTAKVVNLQGWSIVDRNKNRLRLNGVIAPHSPLVIALPPTLQLSNKGGVINLFDDRRKKVDGVTYTKADASREGELVVF
ncbi:MAG TPA: DUF2278 family protein [Longimicrobiaceae bacterium]